MYQIYDKIRHDYITVRQSSTTGQAKKSTIKTWADQVSISLQKNGNKFKVQRLIVQIFNTIKQIRGRNTMLFNFFLGFRFE